MFSKVHISMSAIEYFHEYRNLLGLKPCKKYLKMGVLTRKITRRTTEAKGNYFLQVFTIFFTSIIERVSKSEYQRMSIISKCLFGCHKAGFKILESSVH